MNIFVSSEVACILFYLSSGFLYIMSCVNPFCLIFYYKPFLYCLLSDGNSKNSRWRSMLNTLRLSSWTLLLKAVSLNILVDVMFGEKAVSEEF